MNTDAAKKIADAVLYEGYMLYPYRPSATKNRQRWSFGILYPPAYREVEAETERAMMHSECLVEVLGHEPARVDLQLRFLHLRARQLMQQIDGRLQPVQSLALENRVLETWEEGVERSVECEWTPELPLDVTFRFPESCETERLANADGLLVGTVTHTQAAISGRLRIASERLGDRLLKLAIDIENTTALAPGMDRESALLGSMLSAHTILGLHGGSFVSLLEPPAELQSMVSGCRNIGNFPVLVGEETERNMLLCSPIILYDFPQVAPESAGDFFDGTEMDEMLTLRVMTLTDAEKNEMRLSDSRACELLQRTEQSAREQLMRTHGVIRSMGPAGEQR